MVDVAELTKRYGPVTSVDDVAFAARPGQVTGFLAIGWNGAGKTGTCQVPSRIRPEIGEEMLDHHTETVPGATPRRRPPLLPSATRPG